MNSTAPLSAGWTDRAAFTAAHFLSCTICSAALAQAKTDSTKERQHRSHSRDPLHPVRIAGSTVKRLSLIQIAASQLGVEDVHPGDPDSG